MSNLLRCSLLVLLLSLGCSERAQPSEETAPTARPAPPGGLRVYEMVGPSSGEPRFGAGDQIMDDPDVYPAGSAAVVGAPDFFFRLSQGGAFDGSNVLEIGPTGWAELVFRSRRGWLRAGFQLSADELAGLQRELTDIDVYSLKALYRTSTVEDGTFWFLQVQAAGQQKEVTCTNAFPEPMVRLSYFVRTRVVAPHAAELEQGEDLGFRGPYHPRPPWRKSDGMSRQDR